MERFLTGMFIILILVPLPCTVLSHECSLDDDTVVFDIKSGRCICNHATCYSGTDELHCTKIPECDEGEELDGTGTQCIQCSHGYFKNTAGCHKCTQWRTCGTGQIETEVGNTINDRQCSKPPSTVSKPLVSTKPTTTERVVSTQNSSSFNISRPTSGPEVNESVPNDDDDNLKIFLGVCSGFALVAFSIIICIKKCRLRRTRHEQNDQENPNHVLNGSVERTTEDQTECERLIENSPPENQENPNGSVEKTTDQENPNHVPNGSVERTIGYHIQETTQLSVNGGGNFIARREEVSVYQPESGVNEIQNNAVASESEGLLQENYSDPGHIHLISLNKCTSAGDKSPYTMGESVSPPKLDANSLFLDESF